MNPIIEVLKKNKNFTNMPHEELSNFAAKMQTVKFSKRNMIVRYGDLSINYYVLSKGKIKIIEYEEGTLPTDPDLDNKISMEKFVSEEGFGFGKMPGADQQTQ